MAARISRYSARPMSFRLRHETEERFKKYCKRSKVNASEVVQAAVECFLRNNACIARKALEK